MSVISGRVTILQPVTDDFGSTYWPVSRNEECLTRITIGSVFVYASGARYEVVGVDQPNNRVTVVRVGHQATYVWYVASLLSGLKVSA